jgi:hypothetical protein
MRDVQDKTHWPEATSVAGPSVTYSPARGAPVIAWRGDHDSRNITVAYVTGPPGQLAATRLEADVAGDASPFAPAVHYLRNYGLVLAWVGVDEARTVNVAGVDLPAGSRSVDTRDRAFVNGGGLGGGGAGPPALAAFDPLPMTVACPNDAGQLCMASGHSPLSFGTPDAVDWAGGRLEGVALSPFSAAWTRAEDNRLEFMGFPRTPSSRAVSAQSSIHMPSLAEYRGHLHVAWAGTDGSGHLNVAPVDTRALEQGRDPIHSSRVDILTESTMAAPALLSIPADGSFPERLAIFWTGVDDTGRINGATVYS